MKKLCKYILILTILMNLSAIAQDKLYRDTFPLGDVKLLDSPFKHARDLNIEVLLKYNVDRLLAPYLIEAGLTPKDSLYKNWAGLNGHIGGHYLSALAMNYAAVNNLECKRRMDYMISELKSCQEANDKTSWGEGYVGGVPNSAEIWSKLKEADFTTFRKAWVPWYNIHKMFAGLRDAWSYGNSEEAKEMFLKFCDWALRITSGLTDEQMETMLGIEYGGMNEVLADAYQITGMEKYLTAAKRFSHKELLNPMSKGIDNLDNKHANTQVPKAVGFQRIAELSGDKTYSSASNFFWETVTNNRTLAFGGNSRKEHFPSAASCTDYIIDVDGPETCNTNNMLKLTADLFRVNRKVEYIDYYERALYNHILSSQHPGHGGYVYFTPARPRHYRVYSAPNKAMWCCVGTGMENHGKYNELIYTHIEDSLFVNLFVPSELNWKAKGIKIRQETNFPYEEQTRLIVTEGSADFTLKVRYPSWVEEGEMNLLVNGESIPVAHKSSSFVAVDRKWKSGDVIDITLPMHNSIEHLPNVSEYIMFLHGPIVLAAKTGSEDLAGLVAGEGRWEHIPHGERLPIDKAPIIVEPDLADLADKLIQVKDKPLTFLMSDINMLNSTEIEMQPFYSIHDSRYIMYWMSLTNAGYQAYLDSIAMEEKHRLDLDNRTIDYVAPGEQQPEADHFIQTEKSRSGVHLDEFYRDASDGGYFSYKLSTNGEMDLSLMVTYWGYEWGNRKFDIFIDDEKLISEDNTGRWYQSKYQDVVYKLPNSIIEGKEKIRVKFQAASGSTAGAVYFIRLLRSFDE